MKAVLDAPVAAVAGEQELRGGLGGGKRGEGEHGLAGDLVAGRAAGHVRVVAGGAAGGGGVAAADVVPVPFDEHHLAGAGEPAGDAVRDLAGDADGADLVPAVSGLGGGVQHRLLVPRVRVGEGVQARLVVFQVEDPADPQLVHRLHVPGLRMQCIGRHDDQFFFSCSCSCIVVVVVVVVVVVWAAGAGAVEDGVQEGDEAGDLVGLGADAGLAQDGSGGDVIGGEQVGLGAVGPDGTADGLAVDGDVPPVQPPGGCLGPQPSAQLLVGRGSVDGPDSTLDRLVAGRPTWSLFNHLCERVQVIPV